MNNQPIEKLNFAKVFGSDGCAMVCAIDLPPFIRLELRKLTLCQMRPVLIVVNCISQDLI